jgi:uncharacterized protein GlcG (DUF336 family)
MRCLFYHFGGFVIRSIDDNVARSGLMALFLSVANEIDNERVRVYHKTVSGTGNHIRDRVQIGPTCLSADTARRAESSRRYLKMKQTKNSTPVAWKSGSLSYASRLMLATAKKMLQAGEKEARKQGVPMSIAITDAGGNLMAFSRMDDAALFSIQIALDKAFTTVFGKMPTGSFASQYCAGGLVPLFFHERWITFPGGFPLIKNGVMLGGIGVSGGIGEDIYVARAALKAGGFSLNEVDAAIMAMAGDVARK